MLLRNKDIHLQDDMETQCRRLYLIPERRTVFENLIVAQLIKKYYYSYETRRFTVVSGNNPDSIRETFGLSLGHEAGPLPSTAFPIQYSALS